MGTEITGRADFSSIRYAQCWEDADVLLDALDIRARRGLPFDCLGR